MLLSASCLAVQLRGLGIPAFGAAKQAYIPAAYAYVRLLYAAGIYQGHLCSVRPLLMRIHNRKAPVHWHNPGFLGLFPPSCSLVHMRLAAAQSNNSHTNSLQ